MFVKFTLNTSILQLPFYRGGFLLSEKASVSVFAGSTSMMKLL
jgi:hypothetical protein